MLRRFEALHPKFRVRPRFLAADPADQSGKLKKARAWKLKILSLEAWLAQLASAPEPATAPASPPPDTDAEPEPPSPAEQLSFDF